MISEKQYYSEKRVSSSSLKWFENSPKFFFKQLSEEIKQIKLSFLKLGKKIHMSILEPELFEKNYIYLEYETPKSENQRQFCEEYVKLKKDKKATIKDASIKTYSKAYNIAGKSPVKIEEEALKLQKSLKKYIEYLIKSTEYKDVLNKSTADLINDLKNEIALHKKANELLLVNNELDPDYETHNEYIIFWEYGKTDKVSCKSMIDRFIIDKKNKVIKLVDIKTTSDLGSFNESIAGYKYYRQMAFYWLALYYEYKDKLNLSEYTNETYIVAVQTKNLPECKVFTIDNALLDEGFREIETLMSDISWHYKNNLWDHSREYYEGDGSEKINLQNGY